MKPYIHSVKYYETDKMGVTHHSNYLRFMEEARIDFMDQLGWGYAKMEEEGIGSPVLEVSAKYKKSTTFPDEIQIDIKILKLSGLKVTIGYTMSVKGEVVFTGSTSHCFLDTKGTPVFIEKKYPEFYARLKEFLVSEDK